MAPPTITVTANYPGANAKVVADTVATPIEQEVNGVENMIYMSSRCTNDGQMILDVTFKLGTNLDMAQVLVQNRVTIAEAKLPEEVKRQGVTTKKKSPSILLCVNLISEKETDPKTEQGALQVRPALPEQLRHASTSRTSWPASPASATSPSSARATTACASGSTRRSWRPGT